MGEEYGERRPFQFFTDHIDPFIADATRTGRRHEFRDFAGFAQEVPDPQDARTFARSVLDRAASNAGVRALYRDLLALRRRLPREHATVRHDEEGGWVAMTRGEVEVVGNFGTRRAEVRVDANELVLASDGAASLVDGLLSLPPLSGAVVS
jgi:maltooligosyltrehalose trehalohydrolase